MGPSKENIEQHHENQREKTNSAQIFGN